MPKTVWERLNGCRIEVWVHVRKYLDAEEDMGDAVSGTLKATRELVRKFRQPPPTKEHKSAIREVKRGITEYNQHNYKDAEWHFRQALTYDGDYARAYAYLGNTLYHRNRFAGAFNAWEKAIAADPKSDAAEMARGKLAQFGRGDDEIVSTLKDQMWKER